MTSPPALLSPTISPISASAPIRERRCVFPQLGILVESFTQPLKRSLITLIGAADQLLERQLPLLILPFGGLPVGRHLGLLGGRILFLVIHGVASIPIDDNNTQP